LSKKGVVYILAEDQLPKKRVGVNLEKDLDKLLDNYELYRELGDKTVQRNHNTSKNLVWGYPKQNPNVPNKYYSKKNKK
jgi:hypothetical protein